MCFSENMSLFFGLTGILSSLYFLKKNIYTSIGIGYFALMEIIQYFQYKVIDQCKNKYNILLTKIGYIHICFQPLFFNILLFAFTKKKNFSFLYISFIAGILLASRLFFVGEKELCDTNNEPICGKKTCSITGKKHIAWNVKLRAPGKGYLTPSIGLHAFLFFVPVLTTLELKPILVALLTSPLPTYFMTDNIHEQPAIWCFTSIAQILLSFLLIN